MLLYSELLEGLFYVVTIYLFTGRDVTGSYERSTSVHSRAASLFSGRPHCFHGGRMLFNFTQN